MSTLKFADTHNMVAFLSKPAESEGFEQFVDFLNANPINYDLTVNPAIYTSCIEQFWDTIKAKTINGEVQLQGLVDGKKVIIIESTWSYNQRADEAVNEEMDDSLVRAATTASSLEAEHDSGGGPRRQETMGDTIAQTRSENVSKLSNDPLLARGGSRSLNRKRGQELMGLKDYTRLVHLEGLGEEDASKQRRIADIDVNKDIYLVNVRTDEDMFGVNDLDGDEVIVDNVDVVKTAEETVNAAATTVSTASTILVTAATTITTTTTTVSDVEITLAQALAELKSAASTRPKVKGIVIHEQEQAPTPTVSSQQPSQVKVQDKGKGKMVKPEPVKKISKKDLLRLDEELAFKLEAEEEEEERLAREKAQQIKEANIAWDDIQSKIKADYQLAQRLQAQEQDELTDEEKARLFVQFLEQRRKHFAAKRAEEKRNKLPTRAQQKSIMSMKRENTFVDYRTELVEESSKKAETEQENSLKKAKAEIAQESSLKREGEELEQESSKKQKFEEDKESEELKQCLEIIPDDGDDVTIDVTPLFSSTKSPTIVDYKIYKEGKKRYFQIIRADGKTQ
ncbi:hypothetical protein Tco_0138417, partial [Tanacetum coccineum]